MLKVLIKEVNGVLLQNAKYSEYLYAAADNLSFDEESRTVFTWKDLATVGIEGYWKFDHNIAGN
jgi:hypothetical protein